MVQGLEATCNSLIARSALNPRCALRSFSVAALALALCATTLRAQSFTENFEPASTGCTGYNSNCPGLTGAGWVLGATSNHSAAAGDRGWYHLQGVLQDSPDFGAQSGTIKSYIAADFRSAGDNPSSMDTVSNWLFAPARTFQNGDTISFWTRTRSTTTRPDRLQLRLSFAGTGTSVSGATDVGNYTTLAQDINSGYLLTGAGSYPRSGWQQYSYTISGLSEATLGRFAFRYFVENGGPNINARSNFIGIDSVNYDRPRTDGLALLANLAMLRRRRRRNCWP
jgi:hypothetical protein